ncbi:MAG: heme lyase CcmF/NrfE family subunit [Betaproteobacteria bacterium]|nr:heme lyase CcmF/NrfE family subunit [Betaproteobacteria bacterium]
MIPEFGQLALIVAFCLALLQGVLPLWGAARGDARLMAVARPAAHGQFVFTALAIGCLGYAFLAHDFSVIYVASNSNSALPWEYRMSAVWGSHEGSLLLWAFLLSLWTVAVTVFSRSLPQLLLSRALGVLGLVSAGFLSFLLFTSNPFLRLLPPAPDGRDLNPLLQDPGMIFHPPLLYMGYVGFSVAFAFALAALLGGRLDAAWARWSRPWTLAAWVFLTLGIALGSFWAYYELGWGGWWFWDPVENASFMPWLTGTALVHSLAVTEKRGGFKNWTLLLAITTFSLSLLGTFLVRSGVLTSVHAFATDPRRGLFILVLLALVVGGSLLVYSVRAPRMEAGGRFGLLSRESMLLANNVALAVVAGSVLLGTLYPLAMDVLGLGKLSVGAPYFDTVFLPLMAPVVFLMAVAPFVRWKGDGAGRVARQLVWAAILGAVAAAAILALVANAGWRSALGAFLAVWIVAAAIRHLAQRVRAGAPGAGLATRLRRLPLAYWGMWLAHLGVAVFIIGVTGTRSLESQSDVRLAPGETATLGEHAFRLAELRQVQGPNYSATRARVEVSREGKPVAVLEPEKRMYHVQRMPMTEADIDYGFMRHVYVALGEPVDDRSWILRLYVKPLVGWIWGGCLLMALGGLAGAADRRYRLRPAAAPRAASTGSAAPPASPAGAAARV